jgi:hypothetical protein
MKKTMTSKMIRMMCASLVSMCFLPQAYAADDVATTPTVASSSSSPFAQCAQKNNITLPAKGSGQHLTADQRKEIWSCMKDARKTAWSGCATQNNITLPVKGSGQRLSEDQRSTMKQCMASQGFKHFRHHRHHEQSGQQQAES